MSNFPIPLASGIAAERHKSNALNSFVFEADYSFPSVHALMATVFFTLIIYIFISRIKSLVIRELAIAGAVVLILLVSVSRLYLGVHWLSDIVAGISFGLFWSTLMILTVRYFGLIYTSIKENWYKKLI
jgi:undecaprenyl-diphosphatase